MASEIDVIQFRDANNNLVKTVAAPFTFKAGGDLTISSNGSIITAGVTAAWDKLLTGMKAGNLGTLELWLRSDTGVTIDANNKISLWEDQTISLLF